MAKQGQRSWKENRKRKEEPSGTILNEEIRQEGSSSQAYRGNATI